MLLLMTWTSSNTFSIFKTFDFELATEDLKVLNRHTWYLTPPVVIFSLFSDRLSESEKQAMANRILMTSKPECLHVGKPNLSLDLKSDTCLTALIDPDSWYFFEILGLKHSWLSEKVEMWDNDPDFLEAQMFVRSVKVVNDPAERGIKLISDFIGNLTKNELSRQDLLQVVEFHRRMFPDTLKNTLNT